MWAEVLGDFLFPSRRTAGGEVQILLGDESTTHLYYFYFKTSRGTLLQSWPIHTWQKDTKRSGVIVPFKKIPTSANDFGMVSGRSRRTKRFTDFKK